MFSKAASSESLDALPKELTSPTLRRGKWTVEEERYTEKIIGKCNLPLSFSSTSHINIWMHFF